MLWDYETCMKAKDRHLNKFIWWMNIVTRMSPNTQNVVFSIKGKFFKRSSFATSRLWQPVNLVFDYITINASLSVYICRCIRAKDEGEGLGQTLIQNRMRTFRTLLCFWKEMSTRLLSGMFVIRCPGYDSTTKHPI